MPGDTYLILPSRAFSPISDLLRDRMELEHPPATVLGKIDVALGVRSDAVNLVEFSRKLPDRAEGRYHFAGLAIDDFDLRIVLIDVEDLTMMVESHD